ncbi:hypothetical protein FQV27_03585 [Paracoccus aurantiacus]|uniref:Uncharacterized protein n=1 Tax=Paracoccus aurantiacus TaxID=2599412 RepID=A0A5C6S7V4_9RHOB|nr:hypothetical protein [Paracoccus aurantiacus]TXB70939.1 hypothetical protein FQV27_03585 [Paracoccus aurantiacus]
MNWAYWMACLAGAVVLAVQALEQFRKRGDNTAFERFTILRGVEITSLCTFGERLRGALFYIISYLVIYVFLLASEMGLELFLSLTGERAGPTGARFLDDESLVVDGIDFGKPFYLAAIITVVMATGVLAPLERVIRDIAHRAANIPNGVFKIAEELDQFFEADQSGLKPSRQERRLLLDEFEQKFPRGKNWEATVDLTELHTALTQIDVLHSAVIGIGRYRLFSTATSGPLSALHSELKLAHEKVRSDLSALDTSDAEAQARFHQTAAELSDNMKAIFAVQFIRNGRSLAALPLKPLTSRDKMFSELNGKLRKHHEKNTDALVGATLICAVGTFLFSALVILAYHWVNPGDWPYRFTRSLIVESVQLALTMTLLCCAVGYFSLMIREIRTEQGSWVKWALRKPPLWRLIITSILPSFVAMLFVGLLLLLIDFAFGNLRTSTQMRDFLTANWRYILFFWPLGMCASVGVLIATDQHLRLPAKKTVLWTLTCILPLALIALTCVLVAVPNNTGSEGWMSFLWTVRETLYHVVPITIFLLGYAGLLEFWEDEEDNRKASESVRAVSRKWPARSRSRKWSVWARGRLWPVWARSRKWPARSRGRK